MSDYLADIHRQIVNTSIASTVHTRLSASVEKIYFLIKVFFFFVIFSD